MFREQHRKACVTDEVEISWSDLKNIDLKKKQSLKGHFKSNPNSDSDPESDIDSGSDN